MIGLILAIALAGFLVYLITTYVPMPPPFKMAIYVIVVIVLILYVMRVFGIQDIPLR
jgi:hypothetical protein